MANGGEEGTEEIGTHEQRRLVGRGGAGGGGEEGVGGVCPGVQPVSNSASEWSEQQSGWTQARRRKERGRGSGGGGGRCTEDDDNVKKRNN